MQFLFKTRDQSIPILQLYFIALCIFLSCECFWLTWVNLWCHINTVCQRGTNSLHSFQRWNLEQFPRCDLLRLIPLLGGFVLSVRRGLRFYFTPQGHRALFLSQSFTEVPSLCFKDFIPIMQFLLQTRSQSVPLLQLYFIPICIFLSSECFWLTWIESLVSH